MVFFPYVGVVSRFGVFSVFIMLFFVAAIGLFAAAAIKSLFLSAASARNNNAAPVLTVHAAVVSRRSMLHGGYYVQNNQSYAYPDSRGEYFVTFEVESGDRMEFQIDATVFNLLAEDDVGKLTFKGSTFLSFERTR